MGFQFRNLHHSQFSQPLTKPRWGHNFATYLLKKSALNSSVPGFSVLDSTLFLLLVQIWSMQRAWLGTWKPDQPSGHIGHIGQCQVGSCTFGTFKASLHCATDPPPFLDPLPLSSPLSLKLVGASLSQPHQPMGKVRESEWGVPTRDSQICVQGQLATLSYISPDWALCACSVQAHSELSLCNNTFCCISAKSVSHRCKVI